MQPSFELAARVERGKSALSRRGIRFRPGGGSLTAEELRGLRAILSALDHYADSRFVTAAGEAWLGMFVDAGAAMLEEPDDA